MKIDASLLVQNPNDAKEMAKRLEEVGYDGLYTFEGQHDPFLPLAMAAGTTNNVDLITGIAVAFARNPMLLANMAYDMQLLSEGRFILGLGTQIKPHIERRFSMPWSKPASRMREMVQAIRAIWASWESDAKLDFRGEFYTHTIMTWTFNPGPNPFGLPPIYLAGFGERMVEVVGEVGDGFLVHPLHSRKFLTEYSLPALQRGLDTSGRKKADVAVSVQCITAMGNNDEQLEASRDLARNQIAFYGSTPAYKPALDAHGWGDELQPKLNKLSKEGKWVEMAAMISDQVLETIALIGTPQQVAAQVKERYGDFADRVSPVDYTSDPEMVAQLVEALKS